MVFVMLFVEFDYIYLVVIVGFGVIVVGVWVLLDFFFGNKICIDECLEVFGVDINWSCGGNGVVLFKVSVFFEVIEKVILVLVKLL